MEMKKSYNGRHGLTRTKNISYRYFLHAEIKRLQKKVEELEKYKEEQEKFLHELYD